MRWGAGALERGFLPLRSWMHWGAGTLEHGFLPSDTDVLGSGALECGFLPCADTRSKNAFVISDV